MTWLMTTQVLKPLTQPRFMGLLISWKGLPGRASVLLMRARSLAANCWGDGWGGL